MLENKLEILHFELGGLVPDHCSVFELEIIFINLLCMLLF